MAFNRLELVSAIDESGLGLGKLSIALGKDKSTVSRYLTGKVPITVDVIDAIAEAIGVPAARFFGADDVARDESERTALRVFRSLPLQAREALLRFAEAAATPPAAGAEAVPRPHARP